MQTSWFLRELKYRPFSPIYIGHFGHYHAVMMTKDELAAHLAALNLTPLEAATLLGVSTRTLRREVPTPAEAALRAWRALHERNLPWKPDSVSIFKNDQDQIELHRRHAKELASLLKRVEGRGGPKNPWTVDLLKKTASFGAVEVGFYHLQNEGFSLSTYTRKDEAPDLCRDMEMIEDAAYCIAAAYTKARNSAAALKAVAAYTREHSSVFVTDGPKIPDQFEKARRRQLIETIADKIYAIADEALDGRTKYDDFEKLLRELQAVRFYPTIQLISDVAHAMV